MPSTSVTNAWAASKPSDGPLAGSGAMAIQTRKAPKPLNITSAEMRKRERSRQRVSAVSPESVPSTSRSGIRRWPGPPGLDTEGRSWPSSVASSDPGRTPGASLLNIRPSRHRINLRREAGTTAALHAAPTSRVPSASGMTLLKHRHHIPDGPPRLLRPPFRRVESD